MSDTKISRRNLLKKGAMLAGVVCLTKGIFSSVAAYAEGAAPKVLKLIDPLKNVTAKSLLYRKDATKNLDGTKNTLRKAEDQECHNCQMYKKKGEVDGVEVGSCNMIGGGYVVRSGWCKSWLAGPTYKKKPA